MIKRNINCKNLRKIIYYIRRCKQILIVLVELNLSYETFFFNNNNYYLSYKIYFIKFFWLINIYNAFNVKKQYFLINYIKH